MKIHGNMATPISDVCSNYENECELLNESDHQYSKHAFTLAGRNIHDKNLNMDFQNTVHDHVYSQKMSLGINKNQSDKFNSESRESNEFISSYCTRKESSENTFKEKEANFNKIRPQKSPFLEKLNLKLIDVSSFGRSILFRKKSDELSQKHWFLDSIQEMEEKCPELLEISVCSIGKIYLF